jgi:hypothetical protein
MRPELLLKPALMGLMMLAKAHPMLSGRAEIGRFAPPDFFGARGGI